MTTAASSVTSWLILLAIAGLVGSCGQSAMSSEEFCGLSREGDLETMRLIQTAPGSDERREQLAVVRDINDRLFSNPPAAIAPVARELAPLLSSDDADNDRVIELLDQVGDYIAQNCPEP